MSRTAYYVVNVITLYRLIAVPVLLYLIYVGNIQVFKWLLPISFATDLFDGFLARRYKVTSKAGATLDSVADDLTVVTAMIGAVAFKWLVIKQMAWMILIMFILYVVQLSASLIRYHKITGFHTYTGKVAALFQGCFLILLFLLPYTLSPLLYATVIITCLDLIEETILVALLPQWQANVKGLYWVLQKKNSNDNQ